MSLSGSDAIGLIQIRSESETKKENIHTKGTLMSAHK